LLPKRDSPVDSALEAMLDGAALLYIVDNQPDDTARVAAQQQDPIG